MDMRIAIIAIIAIGALVLVGAILILAYALGPQGIAALFGVIAFAIFLMAIIGFIAFAFWWMFIRKPPININEKHESALKEAAMASKGGVPALTTGINLQGNQFSTGCRLGKIVGYTVKGFKWRKDGTWTPGNAGDPGVKVADGVDALVVQHDFYYKSDLEPFSMLPIIGSKVRRIRVFDWIALEKNAEGIEHISGKWHLFHGPLVGEVNLYGAGMQPCGEAWCLDTQVMDVSLIEGSEHLELQRTALHILMGELHTIADLGMKANPMHLMKKEYDKEIPTNAFQSMFGGNQGQQQR